MSKRMIVSVFVTHDINSQVIIIKWYMYARENRE